MIEECYFDIKISPTSEGSSDVIVVENFHPRWQEGAKKLMGGRIKEMMESYARRISKWTNVPLELIFSDECGLKHIDIPGWRASLDLYPEERKYRSHNIHGVNPTLAIDAVITEYINWLKFAIRDSS